jgi:exonuclease V gamma subunit
MGKLVRKLLGPASPEPKEIDLTLDVSVDLQPKEPKSGERSARSVRVLGWLRSVGPEGQVLHRFSQARGKHELDAWIRHLAMLAAGIERETFMVSKRKDDMPLVFRFAKVAQPSKHLADLIALYRLGQRVPIPLFPDPAIAYVAKLRDGKTPADALEAARRSFRDGYDGRENGYVAKVYGERDPLDPAFCFFPDAETARMEPSPPSFVEVAVRVFRPLLEHMEEIAVEAPSPSDGKATR